jgi:subtilisin-like proprotein convertase family protein
LRARLGAEQLGDRVLPAGILAVGTDAGVVATVRTFTDLDANGTYETLAGEFQPFGGFAGGVRVAMGDFDGDGNAELVTGMGAGGGRVKVWDVNSDGSVGGMLESFLPFGAAFKGGVFVAAGDLNNDGSAELAVSRAAAGNTVNVYSDTDADGLVSDNLTDSFNPFGAFAGGTRIALGNTTSSGGDELIAGQGPGGRVVKVYTDADNDRAVSDDAAVEAFAAFGGAYKGGVYVASGRMENVGGAGAEVIVGIGSGGSLVKIYTDANANGRVGDEPLFDAFLAYGAAYKGGVRVAAGDTDNSGTFVEVVTGMGPGGNRITVRDDTADAGALVSDNAADDNFLPFAANYTRGVFTAFGKVTGETYAYEGLPTAIPDQSTVTSSVEVAPGAGKIKDLDVTLALFHTFLGDLDVTLTHVPSGTTVTLFADIGGTDEGLIVRLNDEAAADIGTADNPNDGAISGQFNPEGAALLSAFDGLDASGEWILTITDDALNDNGTLYAWALNFTF